MSGLEKLNDVVIIMATNRYDMIDQALLRPGRIDRKVFVSIPNNKSRLEIFKVHTKNMPLDKSVNLKSLAKDTKYYSGADIEILCKEAGMISLRKSKMKLAKVTQEHFKSAKKDFESKLYSNSI